MTTGEILRVRAAMKPIATVPRALRTVDVATGEEAVAHHQRSDVCAVPGRRHRGRGHGRAGAGRGGGGEVRRRLRARDPSQRAELPGHPEIPVSGVPVTRPRVVLSARWAPARRTVAGLLADAWGRAGARHRRRHRGAPRAARSPTSSSTRARPPSARSRSRPWPTPSRPTTACWRSAAVRCSTRPPATCWPGTPWCSCASACPTPSTASASAAAARCCSATCADPDQAAARRAHARLRVGGHPRRRHRRPHRRRRGSRDRRARRGAGVVIETVLPVRGAAPYDVVVGHDLAGHLPAMLGESVQRVAFLYDGTLGELAQPIVDSLVDRYDVLALGLPPGEGGKNAAVVTDLLGGPGRGRLHPVRRRRHLRRRRDHGPRRLRRRDLAARCARHPPAHDAARHGRRGRGRQDRHQHRRRQEPRRLLPRARRGALRPGAAAHPAARRAGRRPRRGHQVRLRGRPGHPRPRRGDRPGSR